MQQLDGRALARADLATGVVVTVLGLAVLFLSLRMPTFAERGVNPLTAPGILPGIIGAVLALCGVILAGRSLRRAAAAGGSPVRFEGAARILTGLAIMIAAVALVGRVDFRLVAGAVALAFTGIFLDWRGTRERPLPRIVAVAVTVVIVAIAIPWLFEHVFLVRLP